TRRVEKRAWPPEEIVRILLGEYFVAQLIGERADVRLHAKNGATAERLVHDAAQARVVGLVRGQHGAGKSGEAPRHPPPQPGNAAVLLPKGERRTVLEHTSGKVVGGRSPDFADKREFYRNDWSGRAQSFDRSSGVVKELLAGEINAR